MWVHFEEVVRPHLPISLRLPLPSCVHTWKEHCVESKEMSLKSSELHDKVWVRYGRLGVLDRGRRLGVHELRGQRWSFLMVRQPQQSVGRASTGFQVFPGSVYSWSQKRIKKFGADFVSRLACTSFISSSQQYHDVDHNIFLLLLRDWGSERLDIFLKVTQEECWNSKGADSVAFQNPLSSLNKTTFLLY